MMYSAMKVQRGKTPGTAKRQAPKRPAPKPPASNAAANTDPVEVYCRIRPLSNPDELVCVKVISAQDIILTATENSHAARNGGVLKETKYSFKQVFDDCCPQKAVFEQVALPLVEDVLHGQNALLFAYGITSSGKTYTMMGDSQNPGILPRSLDVIFNSIEGLQAKKYVFKPDKVNGFDVQTEADAMLEMQQRDLLPKLNHINTPKTPAAREREDGQECRKRDRSRVGDIEQDNSYSVFLSYIEIYNKYIYDLLEETEYDPITLYKPPQSKLLREDNNHNMYVSGVVEVEVKNTEEAYEVLERGQKRRRVAHTNLNAESSRSHSVLNIRVVQVPLNNQGKEVLQDKDKICVSQLSLVDLAGSERAARTGNQGDRIREAGNINNALMQLRSCIEALRENQRTGENKFVPYRNNSLTHLFKNYFEGEGRVHMIVCVNPKAVEYDETVNVMKFAMMTQEVQVVRPEKKDFDLGFIHGRRHLKDQFREETDYAKSEKLLQAPISSSVIPSAPIIYTFDPLPMTELVDYDDERTLVELAHYIQDRINNRIRMMNDYAVEEASFRTHLVEFEHEHNALKESNAELKSLLKSKDADLARLEMKLRNLEKAYEATSRKNTSLERAKHSLEREVGEREYQIQMAVTEKTRLEQDNKHRLNWLEKNFNKKMEEAKMQAKEDVAAKLRVNEKKLAKVRNLLETDTDSSLASGMTPLSTRTNRYMARSETDLTTTGKTPVPTPRGVHSRAMTTANLAVGRQMPTARSIRGGAPPPTKPKPNLKYHRRSKSSHEVCLDHNPAGVSDPKSIMTPTFKKSRSVTKLEAKDIKGMDKYLLTTMDVDSEGDQATKLYKDFLNISFVENSPEGDVLRTSTGGKAVIFNDVEVLKHKSPGDLKRKSDEYPEEYADEMEREDRCRIAVEGHNVMNMRSKRIKQSQV